MTNADDISRTGSKRVLVAGATGYIGRELVDELATRGHAVVALRRPGARPAPARDLKGDSVEWRDCDVLDPASLASAGIRGERFDAVFSCLATRGGGPADAWRVEHDANQHLLAASRDAGAGHFVLLSAICVQKPLLVFQHAKLAFEKALMASGISYSIVRPTAFFKSLAGQLGRVRDGKPFLVFGDGQLTACKPIGERDLARYLADCMNEPDRLDAILPIGGPGPALTPIEQGHLLFEAAGMEPKFRQVPVRMFDVAIRVLGLAAKLVPGIADKAEFARIGRYYATESMLVWDGDTQRYDAAMTPETGEETLGEFYAQALAGNVERHRLGDHAMFDRKNARV